MIWKFDALASLFAGITAFLSLVTIIVNSRQFRKIKKDEVRPYLIANFVECFTEGYAPQVQVNFESKTEKSCQVFLKLTNIGVGVARDIVCIYSDGKNPSQAFVARPFFLESKQKTIFNFYFNHIIVNNEGMDSCDFTYDIYYKDILNNSYKMNIEAVYLEKNNTWEPYLVEAVDEPKAVKKINYPKDIHRIKYIEEEL